MVVAYCTYQVGKLHLDNTRKTMAAHKPTHRLSRILRTVIDKWEDD